jgi:hypothetical protein
MNRSIMSGAKCYYLAPILLTQTFRFNHPCYFVNKVLCIYPAYSSLSKLIPAFSSPQIFAFW